MVISFRVFGVPQTKGSTKSFYVKKLNRVVTTNDNPRNRAWSLSVSEEAARHRPSTLLTGPLKLWLVFHMPKPKSLPKRKPSWPTTKPDLDKLLRSATDALTGIIWRDDSQVVEAIQKKQYSDSPGVEIIVEPIEGVL